MYVLSAPLEDLGVEEPRWRYEFEVSSILSKEIQAGATAFQTAGSTGWIKRLYGEEVKKEVVKSKGLLDSIFKKYDLREPNFLNVNGRLFFYFQQLEGKLFSFRPLRTFAMELSKSGLDGGTWTNPIAVLEPGELVWDMKPRFGKYYLTSYRGGHYSGSEADATELYFKESIDGLSWRHVNQAQKPVFVGGVNEASFEWDDDGTLWTMTRNDDGGPQGWGGLLFKQSPGEDEWEVPHRSDPHRYDSPKMFAQDGEIYLVARQNIGFKIPGYNPKKNTLPNNVRRTKVEDDEGKIIYPDLNFPFDLAYHSKKGEPDYVNGPIEREKNLMAMAKGDKKNKSLNPFELGFFYLFEAQFYFKHPKRTALYHLNREAGTWERIHTFPSAGDTAFASMIRTNDQEVWMANYSSPFSKAKWPWVKGQENPSGIYVLKMKF